MHQVIMILRIILVVLLCNTEAVSKTDLETLLVEDHLICKHHSVVLGVDGTKEVPAFYFAANTQGFSEIRIRRAEMNPSSCGVDRSNEFGKAAVFCCEDVGQELYIELTAKNAKGEAKFCMIQVDVFTGGTLNVDHCLPDLIVSCDVPIDLNNLSNFGKFVKDPSHQQPIFIKGEQVGMDGLVQFKCTTDPIIAKKISIEELVTVDEREGCEQGYTITRKMRLIDRGGVMSECVQLITVLPDNTPLTYYDIIWPSDTTVYGCIGVDADPVLLGEPITDAADCENILVNYEDEILNVQDASCTKIIRRWSVLDWCAFEYNADGSGKWDHTQVIRIESNIKPEISNCEDLEICVNEDSCEAVLHYTIEATDECHPAEDLFYSYKLFRNGTDDDNGRSGRSRTVTEYLPIGEHVLHWSVSDGCNNIQSCNHRVTIVDCKAPSIFCITGFTGTLVDNGIDQEPTLEIWANDFVSKAFDNCTPVEELIISLSPDTIDQVIFYDCSNLGSNEIDIFVTDPQGQQSSCRTTFEIQDNNGICGPGRRDDDVQNGNAAVIAGQVTSERGDPIADVNINLTNQNSSFDFLTENDGQYSFSNVLMNEDYIIKPTKNEISLDGISVLDLVLLRNHILGTKPFNSAYKIIAGDVNQSGHLSAIDLVALKSYLLGAGTFDKSNAWKFIETDNIFLDNSNPWPFADQSEISSMNEEQMIKNFIGVKVGDVDHSSMQHAETRENKVYNITLAQNEELAILGNLTTDLHALHFTWTSPTKDHIDGIQFDITNDDLSIKKEKDYFKYSLIVDGLSFENDNSSNYGISSTGQFLKIKGTVVYSNYRELSVDFERVSNDNNGFSVGPNPMSSTLNILYDSKINQSSKIVVYGLNGMILYDEDFDINKGRNTHQIDAGIFRTNQILLVRMILQDGTSFTEKIFRKS